MKAILCTKYGSPDVLELREVEKPAPKDTEVLVKVYAASLNAADFEYLRGVFFSRLAAPLKPTFKIFGSDMAGQVEAVGRKVKQFQPGQKVLINGAGGGVGTFAVQLAKSFGAEVTGVDSTKKLGVLMLKPNKDLAFLNELLEAGKVKPVIDKRYSLSEAAEAFRYLEEGHAQGKVVITLEHNNKT